MIGGSIGGSVTITFSVISIFNQRFRCGLLLVIPGLFAGRGRALLFTLATGFLIDGPLTSINYNLEEIVNSVTCMYKNMKLLTCRYQSTFEKIFGQVAALLEEVHKNMQEKLRDISEVVRTATGEAKRKAEKMKQDMEKKLKEIEVFYVQDLFSNISRLIFISEKNGSSWL